jgi:PAS domain S-box-containing protein
MEGTFKALYEHSVDAILLTSPDGTILAVNPAAEELFGMSEQEIIKGGREAVVDITDPRLAIFIEERKLKGHAQDELTLIRKGGKKFPAEVSSNIFRNENGETRTSMIVRDITERKATEQQIKQLNQQLEELLSTKTILSDTILDSSLEAVVAMDKDMRYIVFNNAAEIISGLKREEVLGKKFLEVYPHYKGMPIESYYQDALSGKAFKIGSVAYTIPQTGRSGYFDASYAPIRDKDGKINGIVATFQEATERVESELKLRQSENRLRLLADHATDVVYLTDSNGKYTYASPSVKRVTGFEPDEIIGHNALEHVHPEDIDRLLNFKEEQKKSKVVRPIVYRRRLKNGDYHWMESTSQSIVDTQTGQVIEIQSTVRDINDRVLLEEELKENEKKFRLLAEQSTDIVYRTDRKGIIIYASPSLEKITGFKPDEVVGHSFFEYIHPEDVQNVWIIREKLIEQDKVFALTYRRITKNGKYLWMESSSRGIRDKETGEVTEFQTSVRDVTERTELEIALKDKNELLQQTNGELEQFIFALSHDLTEPLRSVNVFSKMLIETCADGSKAEKYAERVSEGVEHMRKMLEDLRSYQSVVQGMGNLEDASIAGILAHVEKQLKRDLESTRVQISIGPMPRLYCNKAQLGALFYNLIDNAIKFRRNDIDPQIEIRSEKIENQWQFAVKDNGIGIKQEYENKVFTIFERLHPGDKYSGTGMGLSIARKIVENHGGRIWFRSAEGIGTTFYFTLPEGVKKMDERKEPDRQA